MSHPILILSNPKDVHYQAVDWALKQVGIESHLLFGHGFPRLESQSAFTHPGGCRYEAVDWRGETIDLLAAQTVWYRRTMRPQVSPDIDVEDQKYALAEAEAFIDGMRAIASQNQRWINAPDLVTKANQKPFQLHTARRAGLPIPNTLMSNDPNIVRQFIKDAGGAVLFKPFKAMIWGDDTTATTLYASKITQDDIDDWGAIKLTAHLFQHYVEKQFELRIIYMDGDIHAFKLDSQSQEASRTDWRVLNSKALNPQPHDLPQNTSQSLDRYMKAMGLEFGAIDMIVDPDGNHVFLECNPTGQFLFLEEWTPSLDVLAHFCLFLTKNLCLSARQVSALKAVKLRDFLDCRASRKYYEDAADSHPLYAD